MSRLITPSLIGSISWLKTCPPSWKAKAALDLKNQLGRIKTPMSPALELGIRFEDAVVKATALKPEEVTGSDHFKWVVEEGRGGQFQRKTSVMLDIDGFVYCLYGKIDAWFPDIIKDFKSTSNYKGPDNYLKSFQHKMYLYNENMTKFRYVIAEFDKDQKIIGHYAVDAELNDRLALEAEIVSTIKEAIAFLSSNTELFTLYTTKFSLY